MNAHSSIAKPLAQKHDTMAIARKDTVLTPRFIPPISKPWMDWMFHPFGPNGTI